LEEEIDLYISDPALNLALLSDPEATSEQLTIVADFLQYSELPPTLRQEMLDTLLAHPNAPIEGAFVLSSNSPGSQSTAEAGKSSPTSTQAAAIIIKHNDAATTTSGEDPALDVTELTQAGSAAEGFDAQAVIDIYGDGTTITESGLQQAIAERVIIPSASGDDIAGYRHGALIQKSFKDQLTNVVESETPAPLRKILDDVYGEDVDTTALETRIKDSVVSGDWSWLPEPEMLGEDTLTYQGQVRGGAYAVEGNRIFVNEDRSISEQQAVYIAEIGHFFDTQLKGKTAATGVKDSAGDEGQLFHSALTGDLYDSQGNVISEIREAAARDNDHGEIEINGQMLAVEFNGAGETPTPRAQELYDLIGSSGVDAVVERIINEDFGGSVELAKTFRGLHFIGSQEGNNIDGVKAVFDGTFDGLLDSSGTAVVPEDLAFVRDWIERTGPGVVSELSDGAQTKAIINQIIFDVVAGPADTPLQTPNVQYFDGLSDQMKQDFLLDVDVPRVISVVDALGSGDDPIIASSLRLMPTDRAGEILSDIDTGKSAALLLEGYLPTDRAPDADPNTQWLADVKQHIDLAVMPDITAAVTTSLLEMIQIF
jgi:hypothetical protein